MDQYAEYIKNTYKSVRGQAHKQAAHQRGSHNHKYILMLVHAYAMVNSALIEIALHIQGDGKIPEV